MHARDPEGEGALRDLLETDRKTIRGRPHEVPHLPEGVLLHDAGGDACRGGLEPPRPRRDLQQSKGRRVHGGHVAIHADRSDRHGLRRAVEVVARQVPGLPPPGLVPVVPDDPFPGGRAGRTVP